jgi:hypothetical protein
MGGGRGVWGGDPGGGALCGWLCQGLAPSLPRPRARDAQSPSCREPPPSLRAAHLPGTCTDVLSDSGGAGAGGDDDAINTVWPSGWAPYRAYR